MSKAFTRESDDDEDEVPVAARLPAGTKNYISPAGHKRMKDELIQLVKEERPTMVQTVSWAASNGDRSENGDYIYGKRRLREIDRRIRFLTKRLEQAEVVDSSDLDQSRVFFGATVTYANQDGEERTITIVGTDELDPARGRVTWISPIARAMLKAEVGDTIKLQTPLGLEELDIVDIRYDPID